MYVFFGILQTKVRLLLNFFISLSKFVKTYSQMKTSFLFILLLFSVLSLKSQELSTPYFYEVYTEYGENSVDSLLPDSIIGLTLVFRSLDTLTIESINLKVGTTLSSNNLFSDTISLSSPGPFVKKINRVKDLFRVELLFLTAMQDIYVTFSLEDVSGLISQELNYYVESLNSVE